MKNVIKTAIAVIGGIAVLLLLLFGPPCMLAHGSTSNPRVNRPNSLGVSEIYQNNNAYLLAQPIDGQIMEYEEDRATSVRFSPYNTPALYDESILFCGLVADFFQGKAGPLVVTYDRIAHRRFNGVSCHDIVSVFEVHDQTVKP